MIKFKTIIIGFVFLMSAIFSLFGCGKDNNDSAKKEFYNVDAETYYCGLSYVDVPALENFAFSFPIICKDEIFDLSEITFYNQDEQIDINVKEIKVNEILPFRDHQEVKENGYGFRYNLSCNLNKTNIQDTLKIDKVSIKVDGQIYNFNVDIRIMYKYVPNDSMPYPSQYGRCRINNCYQLYELDFGTWVTNMSLIDIRFAALKDRELDYVKVEDPQGEEVEVFGNSDYKLQTFKNYIIYAGFNYVPSTFVAFNFLIKYEINGTIYECCTDTNRMLCMIAEPICLDQTRVFFPASGN